MYYVALHFSSLLYLKRGFPTNRLRPLELGMTVDVISFSVFYKNIKCTELTCGG